MENHLFCNFIILIFLSLHRQQITALLRVVTVRLFPSLVEEEDPFQSILAVLEKLKI
jgi:hypothetical protein